MITLAPILEGAGPDLASLAAFAGRADRLGFDMLLLGDDDWPLDFEPLTAAAAMAGITSRIGLVASVTAALGEPFTAARGLAALDHLSGGRAGWRVARRPPVNAPPYAHRSVLEPADEAARAQEFVDVVFRLWDSWEADALALDKVQAVFSRADRVRPIEHEGRFFRVRGPLNTPRPRQGRPVVVIEHPEDRRWAAEVADVVVLREPETAAWRGFARVPHLLLETTIAALGADVQRAATAGMDGVHLRAAIADVDALSAPGGPPSSGGTLRKRLGMAA
jgi:alkanesulfonate monooxygenase SsuD/methylene tetrahydromethanopterin reductase-like flavin-dependent oxidoreductase (luciferase family)